MLSYYAFGSKKVSIESSGINVSGIVTSINFNAAGGRYYGDGSPLTNLNGSNIASGTISVARIGTGTKNSTTFYRGDGTFATVTSGSTTTINNNANNRLITGSGTADTLEAEQNLTFDGSTLQVAGSGTPTIESNSGLDITATTTTFSGTASIGGGHPTSNFYSGADDLVVANFAQDTGISIMSGTSNAATVAFGSTTFGTGAIAARLMYESNNNNLILQTQTSGHDIKLKSAGEVTIGDLNNVRVTVEDRSGSSYGVKVDGTIYPNGGSHNLGLSGIKWNNVYANNLHGDGSNITNITGGVPSGTIVMYNGDTAPTGWAICNGQNGTPDLRDKFIVGSGSSYNRGDTGGAASVTLTVNQIPSHDHSYSYHAGPSTVDGGAAGGTRTVNFASSTTGNAGGGQSHENRPPYYALTYIMKT